MAMGIKNMYETEGLISTRDSHLHLLNRSITFYPKTDVHLKPREKRLIKLNVPFIDEISRLTMIKLLDFNIGCTDTIKVKFIRNTGFHDVNNIHQGH